MSETQMRLLFQPFAQADSSMSRRFGGTGLGLTISKRFAELMEGDIEVRSQLDKGSTFALKIPLMKAAGAELCSTLPLPANDLQPATATVDAQVQSLAGTRLLLVEDGPDNQRLISFILKKAGADVTIAENGQIGRDLALAALDKGQPYDVIVTDMQMPIMDGYTATKQLREKGYKGPIIALTAHAMKGDREKCLACGCDDFATKPVDRRQLVEIVASYAMRAKHLASN